MLLLDIIAELITTIIGLHGTPNVLVEEGNYSKIEMADSCYVEVLTYSDSILVVETVCAPACSSRARIYNKEWQLQRNVESPYPHSVFVEAKIENGQLVWSDNDEKNGQTY